MIKKLTAEDIAIRLYKKFKGHIPPFPRLSILSHSDYQKLYHNPKLKSEVGFMPDGKFNPKHTKKLLKTLGTFELTEIEKTKIFCADKRKKQPISEEQNLLNIINAIPAIYAYKSLNYRLPYFFDQANKSIIKLHKKGKDVKQYIKILEDYSKDMEIPYEPKKMSDSFIIL